MSRTGSTTTDVVIVGAGAAGLAAANHLRERGIRFLLLEARDRVGGRIHTVRDPRSPLPIELGAEFLHGEAEEVNEIVDRAGLTTVDVTGARWWSAHGKFSRIDDFWMRLDRILGQADPRRSPDRSLAAFLAEQPGGRRFAEDRTLAREFVEGFHAAELDKISERAVAEGGNPGEDPEEQRLGRVVNGYDTVTNWMAAPIAAALRLRRVVTDIEWKEGRVTVTAVVSGGRRTESVRAKAAIITIPVSLLDSKARGRGPLRFTPEVPAVRAAAGLAVMGHVQRITLLLDRPIIEILSERAQKRLADLSFLHARGSTIPVWWNSYPIRSGLVVGWAGGPAALALERDRGGIRSHAAAALADACGVGRQTIARHLRRLWTHDWSRDPFTRGAYSYSAVGGGDVGKKLSRPVRGTLFFAGEAADPEGRSGTVDGAIASGTHAAKQLIRALYDT